MKLSCASAHPTGGGWIAHQALGWNAIPSRVAGACKPACLRAALVFLIFFLAAGVCFVVALVPGWWASFASADPIGAKASTLASKRAEANRTFFMTISFMRLGDLDR